MARMQRLSERSCEDIDDDERQLNCKVHVVSEDEHLGTWLGLCLRCMRDSKHKEDQAMASYSPLVVKVFGNREIFHG